MSGARPVCPLWVGVQEVSLNPKPVKSVDTGEWGMRYFITAKGERVQTLFSSRAKSVGKLIWASGVLIWPRIKSQEATVTS